MTSPADMPRKKNMARFLPHALLLAGFLLLFFAARSAGAPAASPPPQALPILLYHKVAERDVAVSPTEIPLRRFEEQMKFLADHGYTSLSMDDVVAALQEGKIPPKAVAIHFDDSWSSQRLAAGVLEKYRLKASFFVIVGEIGQGSAHFGWADLRRLSKSPLFGVYSHTFTHPWRKGDTLVERLEKHPRQVETQELAASRAVLEKKLGKPAPYLAWPANAYNDALIERARQSGYKALLTTNAGLNRPGQDPFRIHRNPVDGNCGLDAFRSTLETGQPLACSTAIAWEEDLFGGNVMTATNPKGFTLPGN